jgi:hypothetical protein
MEILISVVHSNDLRFQRFSIRDENFPYSKSEYRLSNISSLSLREGNIISLLRSGEIIQDWKIVSDGVHPRFNPSYAGANMLLWANDFILNDVLKVEAKDYIRLSEFLDRNIIDEKIDLLTKNEEISSRKSPCIMCNDKAEFCMYCGGKLTKERLEAERREALENL